MVVNGRKGKFILAFFVGTSAKLAIQNRVSYLSNSILKIRHHLAGV
ncbi:hypothetical protein [Microbulbifer sp. ANSA005]